MRQCPDWIDTYMKFTSNSEPPDIYRRWTAISVLAAVMQRKCYLEWGPLTFYPNLYVVLVGPPGRARKGTAMDVGLNFLTDPTLGIHLAAEALTREALIRELRESQDTYTNGDGKLITHCSLTVYSPELAVFLGYRNMQLLSDLTDWYDCRKRWVYRTKTSGTDSISGVWVNIIGATTPALLQSSLPLEAIGGGLTSRMIFVYAARKGKKVLAPFYTEEELLLYQQLRHDLELITLLSGTFKVTPDFLEARSEWYAQQDDDAPHDDRLAGYYERKPATATKLSLIMSAAHNDTRVVSGDDFLRAVQYLDEVEEFMPFALSGIGKNQMADVMTKIMEEILRKNECTHAYLLSRFRNDVGKIELDQILATLDAMRFCLWVTNTGKIVANPQFGKD